MASGYVVAALLETAGLIGLVIAAFKIRAERQAKAAELRSFLRSGQMPSSVPAASGVHWGAAAGRHDIAVPFAPDRSRAAGTRPSNARSALSRAVVRGGLTVATERVAIVSAG